VRAAEKSFESPVSFGREICADIAAAERREWLVTNGIGGFACGTVSGHLTRRYHGYLVAASRPPLGRMLLVSKLDEVVASVGESWPLSTNRWKSGAVDPRGHQNIERFHLEGTSPVWTFAFAGAQIEKRVAMHHGANATCVEYRHARGVEAVLLTVKVLVNYRDFHGVTHAGGWQMDVHPIRHGVRVLAFEGATPFYLLSASARAAVAHEWYRDFDLAAERERGLEDSEDHLHAATFTAQLNRGEFVSLIFSDQADAALDGGALMAKQRDRERGLVRLFLAARPVKATEPPAWIRQLVLAADQFVVRRAVPGVAGAHSVLAGYPWFSDWSRDTMVSLPGIALTTGRPEIAAGILRAFSRFVDQGMLPNNFPEGGSAAEYNSVDAALWYIESVRQYSLATADRKLVEELYPVMEGIIDWHIRGTRFHIRADEQDGLLSSGEPGTQLTWMDAKVGGAPVTPRVGKPVEINALWLNAVASMSRFAGELKRESAVFDALAAKIRASFGRFWNAATGYCYDVLDGPQGTDGTLRPNQILAVSLSECALSKEQQRQVVDACERWLQTSFGLRSLDPHDAQYQGIYSGSPAKRDGAYHQGTAWGWLLGDFVMAHLRAFGDKDVALSYFAPMEHHLAVHGLGTASEIFDGDTPHTPRGCFAQAWTVAALLQAWHAVTEPRGPASAAG
jgi:predicted glycogen debranching enzyme